MRTFKSTFKITVCYDLYVEAASTQEAMVAIANDYKFSRLSRYYSFVAAETKSKPEFTVDPKTKELISL